VVRDDGPQTHLSKAGTPTMGGALILVAIVGQHAALGAISATASSGSCSRVTAGFGAVGLVDDYLKLVKKNSRGLPRAGNTSGSRRGPRRRALLWSRRVAGRNHALRAVLQAGRAAARHRSASSC
jgi:hypothetical protein